MAFAAPRYWIRHPEYVWTPGEREQACPSPGMVSFIINNRKGDECTRVPVGEVDGLAQVQTDEELGVDDVCSLTNVSEATLLNTVRVRYCKQLIYTRIQRILIALNPFTVLPIYDSQKMDEYMAASDTMDLPPHIFAVAQDAVQGIREGSGDRAILISGESGAGKTESSKLVLSFVAEGLRSDTPIGNDRLEERVIQTSPVLEAFGNAMTVKNNNSSRFGKWLDLRFSGSLELVGGTLTSYLLETTRVCTQAWNERSFHVFYHLLGAKGAGSLRDFGLREPKHYRYLREGQLKTPGMDDASKFVELQEAFEGLGFSDELQLEVFKIVAGVLTLGNCDFKGDGDGSKLADAEPVRQSAELFQIDVVKISRCMLMRKLVIGKDVTETPHRLEQARATRDGIARLLYGRLFLWIVERLNGTLTLGSAALADQSANVKDRLLGVLDIAGFENFEKNSIEQLMINLVNEHLQQSFHRVVFQGDLEEAYNEGIVVPNIGDYTDNAEVLTLIDGKVGIFELLDETVTVPKATDMAFVTKVTKLKSDHPRLIIGKLARTGFGVRHFVGDVTYSCDGWLEKNTDRPPDDAAEVLAASGLSVLREVGLAMTAEAQAAEQAAGSGGLRPTGVKKAPKTVTATFRASLKAMMVKVNNAEPHYIRCVKPNKEKVPLKLYAPMVMEQLLLNGVLATVRIRQQGYPHRMSHRSYVDTYRCIVERYKPGILGEMATNLKDEAQKVVDALPNILPLLMKGGPELQQNAFAVGKSKVFIKAEGYTLLQRARERTLARVSISIQCAWRVFLARRVVAGRRALFGNIKALLDQHPKLEELVPTWTSSVSGRPAVVRRKSSAWLGNSLVARVGSAEVMQQLVSKIAPLLDMVQIMGFKPNGLVSGAERIHRRAKLELEALHQIDDVRESVDPVDIEKALACAHGMDIPPTDASRELECRLSKLMTQLPIVRAMESAVAEFQVRDGLAALVAGVTEPGPPATGATANDPSTPLREIVDVVEQAGLQQDSGKWLPELGGPSLLNDVIRLLHDFDTKRRLAEEEQEESKRQAEQAEAACLRRHAELAEAGCPRRSRLRKATLTGLEPAEREQILGRLERAADELDVELLEDLLRRATELGVTEEGGGGLAVARDVFNRLQTETFVLETLDEAKHRAEQPDVPMVVLKRLENLSRQLRRRPGFEEEVASARRLVRGGLRHHSSQAAPRSVFQSMDREELEMAGRIFTDLTEIPRLKPMRVRALSCTSSAGSGEGRITRRFSGCGTRYSRASRTNSIAAGEDGGALEHSRSCITESLTSVPSGRDEDEYEASATYNFRNLLVCMGDRPAQECQRQGAHDVIVELARSDPLLRDEVYIQALKQLINNPSIRSALRGWELLHDLCQQAPPSYDLCEFIRAFIKGDGYQSATTEAAGMAKACLMALDNPEDLKMKHQGRSASVLQLMSDNTRQSALIDTLNAEVSRQAAEIERLTAEFAKVSLRLQAATEQLGQASKPVSVEAIGQATVASRRMMAAFPNLAPATPAVDAPTQSKLDELTVQLQTDGDAATFAEEGDRVAIHYTGELLSTGVEFDTSRDGDPFEFTVGDGTVIHGWDEGVRRVPLHARASLLVPARLAYGERGVPGTIPSNADLRFEIELLSVGRRPQTSVGTAAFSATESGHNGISGHVVPVPNARFRTVVRKVMTMRATGTALSKAGVKFTAEHVVGALDARVAEDEEYESLMARWGTRRARAVTGGGDEDMKVDTLDHLEAEPPALAQLPRTSEMHARQSPDPLPAPTTDRRTAVAAAENLQAAASMELVVPTASKVKGKCKGPPPPLSKVKGKAQDAHAVPKELGNQSAEAVGEHASAVTSQLREGKPPKIKSKGKGPPPMCKGKINSEEASGGTGLTAKPDTLATNGMGTGPRPEPIISNSEVNMDEPLGGPSQAAKNTAPKGKGKSPPPPSGKSEFSMSGLAPEPTASCRDASEVMSKSAAEIAITGEPIDGASPTVKASNVKGKSKGPPPASSKGKCKAVCSPPEPAASSSDVTHALHEHTVDSVSMEKQTNGANQTIKASAIKGKGKDTPSPAGKGRGKIQGAPLATRVQDGQPPKPAPEEQSAVDSDRDQLDAAAVGGIGSTAPSPKVSGAVRSTTAAGSKGKGVKGKGPVKGPPATSSLPKACTQDSASVAAVSAPASLESIAPAALATKGVVQAPVAMKSSAQDTVSPASQEKNRCAKDQFDSTASPPRVGVKRVGSLSTAPVSVLAVGAGGVEELCEKLDDGSICWALLRFEVGTGSFARVKFVSVHFNGEDAPAVRRGRLNARTKEALELFGQVHASFEVKRVEEMTIDALCARLLPMMITDADIQRNKTSASTIKEQYEEQIAKRRAQRKKSSVKPQVGSTAKERPGYKISAQEALKAVAERKGCFNWTLLEPVCLELHNAGYGGLGEMKEWLEEDKVLFGAIRFGFGQEAVGCGMGFAPTIVKHIFVHWVGPKISVVQRGKWNGKLGAADALVRSVCSPALRKEAHCLEDLDLNDLVNELRRLTIVSGDTGDTSEGDISVEDYLAALELERQEQAGKVAIEMMAANDEPPLPDVRGAVEGVRRPDAEWNWVLLGPTQALPT